MKALQDSFVRFEKAAGEKVDDSLRPGAAAEAIKAAGAKLGSPVPASLAALYARHDGETPSSSLFDTATREELSIQWESWSEGSFEVRFMSLAQVVNVGTTEAWLDGDGECLRSPPEDGDDAEETVLVPFVRIRARLSGGKSSNVDSSQDDDWLFAVDTNREAVWLYEVGNQGLEGVLEEAPNLAAWFDRMATELTRAQQKALAESVPPAPGKGPTVNAPSELLVKFMVDRKLIELEDGATIAKVARKLAPLLSLKPSKRAVRAVLDGLSDDDQIGEIFADDDLLAKVVIEFVD